MKKNLLRTNLIAGLFVLIGIAAYSQDNSLVGKVFCGYQGWFNCYGDGSAVERWVHWSGGVYKSNDGHPAPGHLNFEIYPEVSEYPASSLFQSGFANLGDGRPAVLFSSYKEETIDKHFEWMKQYGIDGVAVQKFLTTDGVFVKNRDSIVVRVRRAAEKYGRLFYVMYDMKASDSATFCNDLLRIESYKVTESPGYAHQNGKPVLCIWGFGLNTRPDLPKTSLNIINWLKGKGYYVIGGVPANWRTGNSDSWADYNNVYNSFDMISPWTVGRYSDQTGIDNYKNNYLVPDKNYCDTRNIAYQPVVFSGFAWSNWQPGYEDRQNQIPRSQGEFFWRQLYNIKNSQINNMYVAMFDEYDEGTAILKAADSYFDVPTNQYFLTTSADGIYISSDFYMRLTGKAAKVLKGLDPLTPNVTIPYSIGPIFFRTSLEFKYDAQPFWINKISSIKNIGGAGTAVSPQCSTVSGSTSHTGTCSLKFSGKDNSTTESYCYFDVFDVNIPVYTDTKLSFWNYPLDGNGRYVSIDLLMTDGTRLKDVNAKDINGLSMNPSQPRGTVNSWTENTCNIGQWLNGKTIDKILAGYDHPQETGDFSGYIDDITISTQGVYTAIKTNLKPGNEVKIFPNPVTNDKITISVQNSGGEYFLITLTDLQGKLCRQENRHDSSDFSFYVGDLSKGLYILKVSGKSFHFTRKLLIE